MYYYETPDGINRWSENPYPCISTRGIAQYIMFWCALKTDTLEEASAASKGRGYDIIPRDMGKEKMPLTPFQEAA